MQDKASRKRAYCGNSEPLLCPLLRVQQLLQNNPGSNFLRLPPNCVASQVQVCLLSVHLLLCSLDRSTHVLRAGKSNTAVTILIYLKYWPQTHCTTCWTSSYILPGTVCIAKQKSTQSLAACRYCVKSTNQRIRRMKKNRKKKKTSRKTMEAAVWTRTWEKRHISRKKNKQFFSFFPTILQCNKVMLILSNNSRMKRHGMKVI